MLPPELQAAIEEEAARLRPQDLRRDAQRISERYRFESGKGTRLLTDSGEATAYALSRMPATYAAVQAALAWSMACWHGKIATLLDAGAGTGTASWAAASLPELEKIDCLEREPAMAKLGGSLMQAGPEILRQGAWHVCDLAEELPVRHADLVICAYVLNEMADTVRQEAAERLWRAADRMLLIVEPGTPEGYRQLMALRQRLLEQEAKVAAPCAHEGPCPIEAGDWCAFSVRVQRSRLHRMLKEGNAPYEDEKFFYMAFVREDAAPAAGRILRHPQIRKGAVGLTLCTAQGNTELTIMKKNASAYRAARKADAGDAFMEQTDGDTDDDQKNDPD